MSIINIDNQEILATSTKKYGEIIIDGKLEKTYYGDDIIEVYLNGLGSDNTRKVYRRSIYSFFEYVYGSILLSVDDLVINPSVASGYENLWKEKVKNKEIKSSTYNNKVKGIKLFYNWLIGQTTSNTNEDRLLNINPFSTVKQIAENDSEGAEPLELAEIDLMLSKPYGESLHLKERNSLLFELGIITGIRNEALLSITMDNLKKIDKEYVISVVDKENKLANKAIPYEVYSRLIRWYEKDLELRLEGDTIFNIVTETANKIIKVWAKSLGIDKRVTFHSLRTTTASLLYDKTNGNLGRVQMALNHSHTSTTKKYIDKRDIVNTDTKNLLDVSIDKLEEKLEGLTKREMIEMIMGLDTRIKYEIMDNL